jgi:uroporphyrinogen-III synthase
MQKPIYLFSISSHPDTINVNSLDIKLLKPKIDFKKYDYLIATSKQVALVLQQYSEAYKEKKILCISNATAKSLENIGCEVLEVGSGYGDNLNHIIKKYPKKTKWLYLRAKKVASNFVQERIEEGYSIDETIVYESSCSVKFKEITPNEESVLIFTSPSSVHCFTEVHNFKKSYKIVVIGESTKKALPKSIQCNVSTSMSIDACVELAKSL